MIFNDNACNRKIHHGTVEEAIAAKAGLIETNKAKDPSVLRIYRCGAHYHVGHYQLENVPKCHCGHLATAHDPIDAEIGNGCAACDCSVIREVIFLKKTESLERGIERLKEKFKQYREKHQ